MASMIRRKKVHLRQLRWSCPKSAIKVSDSSRLRPLNEILGQSRALRAIKIGLEVKSPGYNIYASGMTGTGRKSTIKKMLRQIEPQTTAPNDICYVCNFQNPHTPIAIVLPPGTGRKLEAEVDHAIQDIIRAIPLIFESDYFRMEVKRKVEIFKKRTSAIIAKLEANVEKANFTIVTVDSEAGPIPQIFPVLNEKPASWDDLSKLVAENKFKKEDLEKLHEMHARLSEELNLKLASVRKINIEAERAIKELRIKAIKPYLSVIINDLRNRYGTENQKVLNYFDDLKADILANYENLRQGESASDQKRDEFLGMHTIDPLSRYKINVIVDNSSLKKAPVVIENTPTYKNLIGSVERILEKHGIWHSDFTQIVAGSILKANGGYLVINLIDILSEPNAWNALKRVLKNRQVQIQSEMSDYFAHGHNVKPQPVDVDVKVILIGDAQYYYRLVNYDEDFQKIFKIRADFDNSMTLSKKAIYQYALFLKGLCDDEALKHLTRDAIFSVVEYSMRLSEDQTRLSTKFGEIADLIREANFWAASCDATLIDMIHIEKALDEKIYRQNMYEEKIKETIARGRIFIETKGELVGQINGLSVSQYGDHSFGRPIRITCQVGAGQGGIVSIDREADLSGKTHRKGIAIITGYFRGMYAAQTPINFSVSLTFEQLYGYIDGDSASSAEIYVMLSKFSGYPIRQDLAVTGSVSQKGEIQPIGGVNEKIEGFFDICRMRGLTGTQGVIIPVQNKNNLMLRKDVVEAVRDNQFAVYAVSTIDEGIEILTGHRAGSRNESGEFPAKSIHGRVDARIKMLSSAGKGQVRRRKGK